MTWSLAESGTSSYLDEKWVVLYTGIQRANDVIRTMRLSPTISRRIQWNMKRKPGSYAGIIILKGKRSLTISLMSTSSFNILPDNLDVPNYTNGAYINIWPDIEADLSYAVNNLPGTQPNIGRANKWAAMAFLAKAYMYQHQYDSALTLLQQVITKGTTRTGYALCT
jgi:hypothetical protein